MVLSPATAALVNDYYTLCIPFYREFLGEHWHTGFYLPGTATSVDDQRRMERVVAESAKRGPGLPGARCGLRGRRSGAPSGPGHRRQRARPDPERAAAVAGTLGGGAPCAAAAARLRPGRGLSNLPYPDASFDVVLFFESACHFPDRTRFLRKRGACSSRAGAWPGKTGSPASCCRRRRAHRIPDAYAPPGPSRRSTP
ncbi:class I SAM-dependent methyltransferase [Massilia sp. B-10]|nr:class I SAM-dependent methyltransferase [Massilia sp. B-10]